MHNLLRPQRVVLRVHRDQDPRLRHEGAAIGIEVKQQSDGQTKANVQGLELWFFCIVICNFKSCRSVKPKSLSWVRGNLNEGDGAVGKTVLCQVYANRGHFTSDYNMVTSISHSDPRRRRLLQSHSLREGGQGHRTLPV